MGPSWCVQREVVCGNIGCNNIMQFKAVKVQMQLQSLEGSASDWKLKEKLRSGTKMQWLEFMFIREARAIDVSHSCRQKCGYLMWDANLLPWKLQF
jgi:hypothetical protein